MVVVHDPSIIVFEAMDKVLSYSCIDAEVEISSVCISLFKFCVPRTLPLSCFVKLCQASESSL
jgi:hypothetical protein